ncbi:hypothetical protein AIM17_21035, partial [Salmonella enterica subsp. enterica serovar Newport]
IGLTYQF